MKILIVGAGKLGYKLSTALSSADTDITVVDTDADVLERISEHLDVMVVKANGIQIEALTNLNIESYDLAIVVTENDETNMVICSICKKLGCNRTIARIRNPEFANQQEFIKSTMGIDYIVNPELATAKQIIKYLLRTNSFYYGDFAEGRILMVDFAVNTMKGFAGKKIKELSNLNGILIAAISRNGEMIIPHGETLLHEDDIIYAIGKKDSIGHLAKKNGIISPMRHVKKVMIMGGGRIGYYLAENLTTQGIAVKIIEKDKERCDYLSEILTSALVIHADGTDLELLNDEDVLNMDAFIGVTGYDEENLLMTLMAKQLGVKKVLAKVSKPSYVQIIEKLGVDVAVSPADITASDIIKYIRGGRVVSVSLLLGGQAEVTEVIADESMPVVGKTLAQLSLPKGIMVGAIVHKGKVIVPNGSSIIYPDDRFVLMCLSSQLDKQEAILKKDKGGFLGELWHRDKNPR